MKAEKTHIPYTGAGYARISEEDKSSKESNKQYIESETKKLISHCNKNGILISEQKILEISIINQVKDIIRESEVRNVQLYRIYIDHYISGSEKDRQELNLLKKDAADLKFKFLIFSNRSRIFRDSSLMREFVFEVQDKWGIKLISFGGDSGDKRKELLTDALNELKIVEGQESADRLMARKKSEGLPFITPPYGYGYDSKKNWIIDKKKEGIVQECFRMFLEGKPTKEIIKTLKIPAWRYHKVLKNPCYIGKICHKHKVKHPISKEILRIDFITYAGNHEPIIETSTWNDAQAKLQEKKNRIPKYLQNI